MESLFLPISMFYRVLRVCSTVTGWLASSDGLIGIENCVGEDSISVVDRLQPKQRRRRRRRRSMASSDVSSTAVCMPLGASLSSQAEGFAAERERHGRGRGERWMASICLSLCLCLLPSVSQSPYVPLQLLRRSKQLILRNSRSNWSTATANTQYASTCVSMSVLLCAAMFLGIRSSVSVCPSLSLSALCLSVCLSLSVSSISLVNWSKCNLKCFSTFR